MIISEIPLFLKKTQRLSSDVLRDSCSEKLRKICKVPTMKYLSDKLASLKFPALLLMDFIVSVFRLSFQTFFRTDFFTERL